MQNLKNEIQIALNAFKSGKISKAKKLTEELLVANPNEVFLYNLLGLILSELKKIDQAIECYNKGLKIDSTYSMLYNNIAQLLFSYKYNGNQKKIEEYFKKSISLNKKIPEPHNNLGNFYKANNNFNEAILCFKESLKINNNFYFAHHNLATTYVTLGKYNEAKAHFFDAIKIFPNFYNAHRSLSRIIKYDKNNEHFLQLVDIHKNLNLNKNSDKMLIGYSLGKAYEDIGDFDKSFAHYKEANESQNKDNDFSLKETRKYFENIKNTFNKDILERYKIEKNNKFKPIFIVGMPRSGTTLVEQIISNSPNIYGADEVNYIPELINENFDDLWFDKILNDKSKDYLKIFKKMGTEYITKMLKVSDNLKIFTDKLPVNFLFIGIIKIILPNAIIIHCQRNPKDNILSIYKNYFTSGKITYASDLNNIVGYYQLYSDLMTYWNNVLPNSIYNIKYENLILNPDSEIEKLIKECGLEWNKDFLNYHTNKRPIKTASDTQARSKIYNSSINSWIKYKKNLTPYFRGLFD